MPAASSACVAERPSLVARPRFIKSRPIEKPPQHGERPYAQLVDEAFDGSVMRLSRRLRLLEEADTRGIRRGDAIDLIAATQRRLEKEHSIRPRSAKRIFARHFAAFAAAYVVLAMAWCAIMSMT